MTTKSEIQALRTSELRALVRSTNPAGKFWMQLQWATAELARRAAFSKATGGA